MNRNKLKTYAPEARREFIQAMTDRAAFFGLTAKEVEPIVVRGDVAVIAGRDYPRAVADKRQKLEARIARDGFEQTMEAMAYTWFNRLVAIRFMELHGYLDHGYRVLSHPDGKPTPEILEHAEHVDLPGLKKERVIDLKLDGNKESDLYRLLLTAQCNALHKAMPFLFERIDDETELLLPDNLLHTDSLVRKLVDGIDEGDWKEVEIIGWLYQFYISEKKDEVIGKVVASADIPAATQLFTPNWIVKYLVQNTLGRQWLATYPNSPLRAKMDYYIEPAEQTAEVAEQLKTATPTSLNPEELTMLDPACGSCHILVEGYDLFKSIYLERGYRQRDIPALILQKNLFGLEIDGRAAQLGAFALMMKARADDRKIFEGDAKPNIVAFEESAGLDASAITEALNAPIGVKSAMSRATLFEEIDRAETPLLVDQRPDHQTIFSKALIASLLQVCADSKTFGSLLRVPDDLSMALSSIEQKLEIILRHGDLLHSYADVVRPLLKQTRLLAGRYDVVVANPPYMGSKGMNPLLKKFAQDHYSESKSDLFAMFIERGLEFVKERGYSAMVTMESWMFLSSYETLRAKLLYGSAIQSMVHMPYLGKGGTSMGINFGTTAFVAKNETLPAFKAKYSCVRYFETDDNGVPFVFPTENERKSVAMANSFRSIPGAPIAYWVTDAFLKVFAENPTLGEETKARQGLATGDNGIFARLWFEVSQAAFCATAASCEETLARKEKWYPYNKGGDFRRWYGNIEWVVNWSGNGAEIRNFRDDRGKLRSRPQNTDCYFQPGVTWSDVTSGYLSVRSLPKGCIYDISGHSAFPEEGVKRSSILAFLNTKFAKETAQMLNPTLHFQIGDYQSFPYPTAFVREDVASIAEECIQLSRVDWDSFETSWNFDANPLVRLPAETISKSYVLLRESWSKMVEKMRRLEEESNRIFIDIYDLGREMTSEVPLEEVTLTCNPTYRYGVKKTAEELDALLLADTMRELLSYAMGCVMGRYSLGESGLAYALVGNKGFDIGRYAAFRPDEDGIVPLLDVDWGFEDDAVNRVVEFLGTVWPKARLEENIKFVADGIAPSNGLQPREVIRRYLSNSFAKHHLSVYQKRPIYWVFSSGRHRAFQCVVYLHRYHEGTLARIRTEYVMPIQGHIASRIEQIEGEKVKAPSTSHRKKLQKEQDELKKKQVELRTFEENLKHFADQRISIDLDDGVKTNYGKFGDLLAEVKAVAGGKDDE